MTKKNLGAFNGARCDASEAEDRGWGYNEENGGPSTS